MKLSPSQQHQAQFSRTISGLLGLWPTLLLAHPGHYHPEETDEFDFFKATFFHSHGALDLVLAVVFLASLAGYFFGGKPVIRLASIATAVSALVAIPLF
jgi:hypothetical protein